MKTTFDLRRISAALQDGRDRVHQSGGGGLSGNIGSFITGQIRRVSGCEGGSRAEGAESSAAGRAAA